MEAAHEELVRRASRCTGPGSTPTTERALKSLFLLTDKPVLAVVNLGEDQLDEADELVGAGGRRRSSGHGEALGVCVQLEAEAAQLPPDERAELLEGLGLGDGALPACGPERLPPARAAGLPHHRGQGVAGLELPGRRHAPPSAPG